MLQFWHGFIETWFYNKLHFTTWLALQSLWELCKKFDSDRWNSIPLRGKGWCGFKFWYFLAVKIEAFSSTNPFLPLMQTAVSFLRHSTVRKAASPLSEDVSVWHVSLMLPAPCDTCPDVSLFSSQSEDWNFDTRYLWSNVAPDDLSLPPGGSFALSCWHASRDSAQFSDTCIWWRHVWLYGCQPGGQSVTV